MSVLLKKIIDNSPGTEKCVVLHKKRADRKAYLTASITVEASLVFPMFFFMFWFFWQFFLLLLSELAVINGVRGTVSSLQNMGYAERFTQGKECEALQYIYEGTLLAKLTAEISYPAKITSVRVYSENEVYYVKVAVDFKCAAPMFPEYHMSYLKTMAFDPCIGVWDENKFQKKEEKADGEEYVYVTKSGTVYHKSVSCRYLGRNTKEVGKEDIDNLRNKYGRRYQPCDVCRNLQQNGKVYITEGGEKYHLSATCRSFTHEYTKVKLSEVQDKKPCSSCGG